MKKLLTLFAILVLAMVTMAQTPKISFQAVVRDANNRLVTNTAITVDVTVTYGSNTYSETNIAATTNANGLVSLTIGNGTGFDAIDWSNATIKTTVHNGSETVTSEVPVTAVPYALCAKDSGVDPTHPTIIAIYNKMAADSTLLAGGINNLTTKQKSDSTALAGQITNLNTTLSGKMKADSTTQRAALADTTSALRNIIPTKTSALTNDANFVNNTACDTLTFCELENHITALETAQEANQFVIDSLKNVISQIQNKLPVPTVTTSEVSNISSTAATLAGNLVSAGITAVSERGFCYSTTETPTTAGTHVAATGTGTGSFTSGITGLTPATTYYVRAYATNGGGTAYGEQRSFTTNPTIPTVTTNTVSNIAATTASCGGNVTATGGADVTARGVCWSTSQNPTVSDSHTTNGTGTGSFTSSMTGLTAGTTYYVRAYATNSVGTAYGTQQTFTTPTPDPCNGVSSLTDIDGNTYNTVAIGTQCWMKENLRTTRYANGTAIQVGTSNSTTTPYRYAPNGDESNVATYGYLYNWAAVMNGASSSDANPSGVQGICPTGWHVPSDAEWTQLTNYVSSQSQYVCGNTNTIAKALASTTGWTSSTTTCAVGNIPDNNNKTGFSVLPAGYYSGNYYGFGLRAYLWSATEKSSTKAYGRFLYYPDAKVSRSEIDKYTPSSVRCVRNSNN